MTIYNRGDANNHQIIDRWERGIGWVAHPDEDGERASHAVVGEEGGVWVIDPIDTPDLDDVFTELGTGDVVGIAVLSDMHTRDAGSIAARHDVPVYLPQWMDQNIEHIAAPIERYTGTLGESGFQVRKCKHEAIAYRESDRTLCVADVLGTTSFHTVADERIGVFLPARLFPPKEMNDFAPDRILVGHGTGVFEDATSALTDAIQGARKRFPKALMTNGRTQLRATITAIRD